MRKGKCSLFQVRAAALTNFDQVASFVGLDPMALLRSAGLDPSLLKDPEQWLPLPAVAGLLEEAARRSHCQNFGLLMAESRSLASIGPVSLLLMHQPRVSDVVLSMVRYQHLFGSAVQIELQPIDDALIVRVELLGSTEARQGTELVVAYFCRCIAAVLGRPWHPESVHFTHSAPADQRAHRRIFSCPVDFSNGFNGFVCAREALQEQNPARNEELAAHAERLLRQIMPPPGTLAVSERVRRSLLLLLPEQRATIDQVAGNLGLTQRSLQRLLEREGASFGVLLNEVRRELAQRYLSATHQVGMVANMTGYKRASSFTRWFCGEFGMPPADWRQRAG